MTDTQAKTGRLEPIGRQRLGLWDYFEYWRCVDCGTDYPQLFGNAGPSCNGCQISHCPYCRPKEPLP